MTTQYSSPTTALFKALGEFQSKVKAIPKTADNPFFKSKFAPLPQIVEYAQPILTDCNLVVSQDITTLDGQDALETCVFHIPSGEYKLSVALLHLAKDDPQAQASAVTYLRRYAYVTSLGLQVDKDDDGQKGSEGKAKESQKKQERNTSLDKLRAELSKAFSVPSERKAYVAKVLDGPKAAEDMTEAEIATVMLALSSVEVDDNGGQS